jgi:acyl-CoA thioesterase
VTAADLARGPWDPGALHGGPVSALLALGIESLDADAAFLVARLTVELERPVPPHRPLVLHAHVIRPGRKVKLGEATLSLGGQVIARSRALFIRRGDVALPETDVARPEPAPRWEGVLQPAPRWDGDLQSPSATATYDAFHNTANEHRFVEGNWVDRGPVCVWIRLLVPLFAGRELTPLQRVAAAADFGNGVSSIMTPDTHTFINPDLTIHQHRPLVGEWVGMRTKTHASPFGLGFAESELFDRSSRIGRSVQSLLIESRST